MSVHRYSSYGRTRQPKSLGHTKRFNVTASQTLADLNLIGQTSSSFTPANGIYKTENQRYMHLISSGSNSGFNKVYAYTYAAANWSELVAVDPSDSTNRDSIICGANQHIIVDIKGVDLVAVVTGSSAKLTYQNFIAFSTF